MDTVKVILSRDEAERFKMFKKHYELFLLLEAQDISSIQFGKFILNYAGGTLQNVVREEVVWRR